jgi:hypothetical protein
MDIAVIYELTELTSSIPHLDGVGENLLFLILTHTLKMLFFHAYSVRVSITHDGERTKHSKMRIHRPVLHLGGCCAPLSIYYR